MIVTKINIVANPDPKTQAVVERELRKMHLAQLERQNISKKALIKRPRNNWWPW